MKEFKGFVGNPQVGIYVPEGGRDIYRINAKNRLTKVTRFESSTNGYMMIEHHGRLYYVHQLIFKTLRAEEYATGTALKLEIDHIDSNKRNNSITNLRMLTRKENALNRVNRGGRQVVAHNPTTFETMIFTSIKDTSRYLKVAPSTIIAHLNTGEQFKGWFLNTTAPTQKYVYYVDGENVASTKQIAEMCGTSVDFLYTIFTSGEYGNKIDIGGHTVERIAVPQKELALAKKRVTTRRGDEVLV